MKTPVDWASTPGTPNGIGKYSDMSGGADSRRTTSSAGNSFLAPPIAAIIEKIESSKMRERIMIFPELPPS